MAELAAAALAPAMPFVPKPRNVRDSAGARNPATVYDPTKPDRDSRDTTVLQGKPVLTITQRLDQDEKAAERSDLVEAWKLHIKDAQGGRPLTPEQEAYAVAQAAKEVP